MLPASPLATQDHRSAYLGSYAPSGLHTAHSAHEHVKRVASSIPSLKCPTFEVPKSHQSMRDHRSEVAGMTLNAFSLV